MDLETRLQRLVDRGWRPQLQPHLLSYQPDLSALGWAGSSRWSEILEEDQTFTVGWTVHALAINDRAMAATAKNGQQFLDGGTYRTPRLALDAVEIMIHKYDRDFMPDAGAAERLAAEQRRYDTYRPGD